MWSVVGVLRQRVHYDEFLQLGFENTILSLRLKLLKRKTVTSTSLVVTRSIVAGEVAAAGTVNSFGHWAEAVGP